ncbi:MAG: hypothetical protein J0M15_08975 [Deltaproteobacteria bacterium]|nr:hypothetical protein [Deltaproteobacteria bacterium]
MNKIMLILGLMIWKPFQVKAIELTKDFNFQGNLLSDSTGSPITTATALVFEVLDPSGTCLLYQEAQSVTPDSEGFFSVKVGSGTRAAAAVDGGALWKDIFQNNTTVSARTNCSGYTPAAYDGRKLRVTVNGVVLSPDFSMSSVPMATVAESLQGKQPQDFVPSSGNGMVNGSLKLLNQSPLKFQDFAGTNSVNFQAPSSLSSTILFTWPNSVGTPAQVLVTDGSGNLSWVTPVSNGTFSAQPQWSGVPSGTNDLTNKAYVDALVVAGLPNVGTPGTYSKVTTDTKGRVTAGTSLVEADIPNLVSAGKVNGAAINVGTLGGSAAINTTGNLVTTGTVSGQTLSATNMRFYNSSNYLEFTAPTLSGNTSFILPSGDSTGTQYLRSDGSGNLSWGTPGGAGTVNTGAVDQLAFYAAAGNTVSGLSTSPNGVLVTNGSSTPSISSTLPSVVQNNISSVGNITSGTWNGGLISAHYGGTGINSGAAANGTLLIGNGAGFNLTNLNQAGNQGVTIANGSGSISLGTVQDIRTTAAPSFSGVVLNNAGTNLSQSVSVGTSYGITWPGTVASTAGSVLTSTSGGLLSWTPSIPAVNGGTGQTFYATGDLLYASSPSTLAKLSSGTNGFVLTSNGAGTAPSWQGLPAESLSSLTPAVSSNVIDNLNFAQNWNWSTANTQTPLSLTANSLTTGTALNISTSSNTLNSSNGLLSVVNSGTSTAGVFAKLQANSAGGSGMTLLTNGYVGMGTSTPIALFHASSNSMTNAIVTGGAGSKAELLLTGPSGSNFPGVNLSYMDSSGNFQLGKVTNGSSNTTYPWLEINGASGFFKMASNSASVGAKLSLIRVNNVSTNLNGNVLGNLNFEGYNGSGNSNAGAGLSAITTENWALASNGTALIFKSTSNGSSTSTERMRVDQNGNIGIGTTTPQTSLDVAGVIKVAKYASQPFACDAAHDSSLAITSGYRQCVCKGGATTWVFTSDGTTPCTW